VKGSWGLSELTCTYTLNHTSNDENTFSFSFSFTFSFLCYLELLNSFSKIRAGGEFERPRYSLRPTRSAACS
jgi:hypothetical protein